MKVLGISGSLRDTSSTGLALLHALAGAEAAGAQVENLSLNELALPMCDGRSDEGSYGEAAESWRRKVSEADALIIGSPEYHGSMTGALKNAFDLLGPDHLRGTMVGLLATAHGDAGAMNTLNHLRHILRWMNAWVLPNQVSVPRAHEAFGEDGQVLRDGLAAELRALGSEVVRYAGLLGGGN